jgi:hypothetical protein
MKITADTIVKHNLPDLVSSSYIQKLPNGIYYLTIHLHDRHTALWKSNTKSYGVEDENKNFFNLTLEHPLLDMIDAGYFRYFETRSKEDYSIVFIPTIDFLSKPMLEKIKERVLVKPEFKKYFLHLEELENND